MRSRRVIKRPALSYLHKRQRLEWCMVRRQWNLRTWRRVHRSDESRFLLHVTDGRMRVWRLRNNACVPRNIHPTVPYGGGSVVIWGCVSHDCKLQMVTVQGNLNGQQYMQHILDPVLVPHFDNHPLVTHPTFKDDNARPHHTRAVTAYLQNEAIMILPCPSMSLDLNPLDHIWDFLGRCVRLREPPVSNLAQLEAALHEEWQ